MNKEEFELAIKDLKTRLKMPEILAMYGILLPQSRKIICPFHNERTASMHIYQDHFCQILKC